MRISNGPYNGGLSHPEIGESEQNTDLLTLKHESGIIYNPTCKANVTKLHPVGRHKEKQLNV
jgi:hypothetical protein